VSDRAKTLWSTMPAVSAASALNADNGAAANAKSRILNSGGSAEWITNSPATLPSWLKFDFGSAAYFDSTLICGSSVADRSIKDGGIEWSDDDATWHSVDEFTNLFGASAPSPAFQFVLRTFTRTSARYWRIRIDSRYGTTYLGCVEWGLFDSTAIGARLDNDAALALTFHGASGSKALLNNRAFQSEQAYRASSLPGMMDIDFGSAQYLGGFEVVQYPGAFWVGTFLLVGSDDGSTWEYLETVTPPAAVNGKIHTLAFARIHHRRYFRFFVDNGTGSGIILQEWFVYASLTPAVPPDPTSVVAAASPDDDATALVRWSQAAGDDNAAGDIRWTLERQKDGGGWGAVATGLTTKFYVDPGLADGEYEYRVTAVHAYHAQESSAVAAAASVTIPAAGGAGGGIPTIRGSLF
jgi:hypothetical protein